ncbi:MAG: hypothetical protein AB7P76_06900 [Candidatus Melainabacteria bacterium]
MAAFAVCALLLAQPAFADCAQYEQEVRQLLATVKNDGGMDRNAFQARFQQIVNAMQRAGCHAELMNVMGLIQREQQLPGGH